MTGDPAHPTEAYELPLFALRTVLFPGRPLPLHIFEDRYRELLTDALQSDRRFGVVAIRQGAEVAGDAEVFDVGTVAEIEGVEYHDDGRADVTTRGLERFRIVDLLRDRAYLRARVLPCVDAGASNGEVDEPAAVLRRVLGPYLADLGAPQELLERLPSEPTDLTWLAAAALHVDVCEQQRLLELDGVGDRIVVATRMLRRESGIMRHLGAVASLNPPGPGGADLN